MAGYQDSKGDPAHQNDFSVQNGREWKDKKEKLNPVVICGFALRLPGGIRDGESFWEALLEGKDMKSAIPPSRFNSGGYSKYSGQQYGYFLDEDLSALDTSFFNMRKSELEVADPQQRQLLEVTRECLENAGEVDYRGKSIGCYVGTFGEDWQQMMCQDNQTIGGGTVAGFTDLMLANRISYEYDFQGPSLVIKSGCSAGLVSLHEACRALQNFDCESAIVAGTNLIMSPHGSAALSQEGVISPDGSSKTFDASANGYARGEAINALFIKRLDDAIRDGNPIRAVIRNTGTNSDGRGQGLMTPNGKTQEALIRKVYSGAKLDPRDTSFVECHGTGTSTGDKIEAGAVGNVFGEHGVMIGAVKPNVGHSEGASGITSVIKAIMSLENKTIPPNIKFIVPNPEIPFEQKKLTVPVLPTLFPKDKAERISVSSYGIGGTNAHIIVESLQQFFNRSSEPCSRLMPKAPMLLVFSANTKESLRKLMTNYQRYVNKCPESLEDLSYTLSVRREHLPFRAFSVYNSGSTMATSPIIKKTPISPKIAMIFSGQGAQWFQMARDLMDFDQAFRADIRKMDAILRGLHHPPAWTMEDELQKPASESRIGSAELSQPICNAIQIALVNTYSGFGVFPTAVIGHSSGEIAAFYAAGGLSMREAIIIAYYRGFVIKDANHNGRMAAIGLSFREASEFLVKGVNIACENSPENVTISGETERVRSVITSIKIRRPDVLARELRVDIAYHSEQMRSLELEYIKLLQLDLGTDFSFKSFRVPLFSTTLGERLDNSSSLSLEYWSSNLLSPVLFNSTARRLMDQFPNIVLLEIGPHSTLAGPLREIAGTTWANHPYISSMVRFSSPYETFLSAMGQLYQHGAEVNLAVLNSSRKVLYNLPNYPWDRVSHWNESRVSKSWRHRQHPHHPLLGQRLAEGSNLEPSWRAVLKLEDEAWLRDHKVGGDVVFPFAGYVAIAGEAVRQLSSVDEGYKLRHVVAHTALVLEDLRPVEIFTNLRPHRVTDISKSSWWDFTISSCTGTSWVEHCHGQVRSEKKTLNSSVVWNVPALEISSSRWYDFTKRLGLHYGTRFQGLKTIKLATEEFLAIGHISTSEFDIKEPFFTHPSIIDSSFQLMLAAATKGSLKPRGLHVPTLIEELYVSNSPGHLEAKAWISQDETQNGVECIANGRVFIQLRNMRLSVLRKDNSDAHEDVHAAAYLSWSQDFDFTETSSLFEPLPVELHEHPLFEEMALLCILDSATQLAGITPHAAHLQKLKDWIHCQARSAEEGTYPLVPDCQYFARLSPSKRLEGIRIRFEALCQIPSKTPPATGLMRLCQNTQGVFKGEVDPLELLLQDGVLTELYNMVSIDCGAFVRALSNKKPNIRILEVGAGTGGTTAKIFKELFLPDLRHTPYSLYSFTDISAGFFDRAQERFSSSSNVEYKTFDISKDPSSQGFDLHSYDLIIAANCVHTTPSLKETLKHLHSLLRPDGHLLLSELCTASKTPGYLFGVFSGWWMGGADNRKDAPTVSLDRWDEELKGAGFDGVSSSAFDSEGLYHYCAAIVSQPSKKFQYEDREISVLCDLPHEGISASVIEYLGSIGFEVSTTTLGQITKTTRQLISTLDLETPFFDNENERFEEFKNLLQNEDLNKVLWILPPSQVRCRSPNAAKSLGVLRIARAELALPITTLEIDKNESLLPIIVANVFGKITSYTTTNDLLPDMEFVYDNGAIKTGRFHPFSLNDVLAAKTSPDKHPIIELGLDEVGLLNTLRWAETKNNAAELKDDEVEISTRVVGMNFRDLALAVGFISSQSNKFPLGSESSGVVRRIGSEVKNVSVGDRVCALSDGALFTSTAILKSPLVEKIPDSLSFEDAATMPICFGTVIRSLVEISQLQKGQTILIHSACGGVGHAAIQISELLGAQIYATVGSEPKANYLTKTYGIPRDHIFHSRDDSFTRGLLSATGGRGADVVLNSLSGELLNASWDCVAEFGTLIELGKRDLAEFGKLNMEPFLANRSYRCVDYAQIMSKRPEIANRILQSSLKMYESGIITPISPVAIFEASEVEMAFHHMERGNHIGKAVVRIPEDLSSISVVPNLYSLLFDHEAAYIVTGGFGGLGRVLLTWMADSGARQIILISRTAGSKTEHQDMMAGMRARGCSVRVVMGRIENNKDAAKVVAAATKPIRGVIHLAMVLRDSPILDMSTSQWNEVVNTKCAGAWYQYVPLESVTIGTSTSARSSECLRSVRRRSYYSAANTFLEAFCQYRHSLGSPASVINLCPIDDAGFVSENQAARKSINAQGLACLSTEEFLHYIELAVLSSFPDRIDKVTNLTCWHNSSHLIMGLKATGTLSDPNNQTCWRHDRRMGFYHNISLGTTPQKGNESKLTSFVESARLEPALINNKQAIDFLSMEIGKKIFTLLLRDTDDVTKDMKIREMGLDSLMAIELRRWWWQTFQVEISVLEILNVERLAELGEIAGKGLRKRLACQ